MIHVTFDEATTAALRAYARACDALDAATEDGEVLRLSELRTLAALQAREALTRAGWTAPTRSRTP